MGFFYVAIHQEFISEDWTFVTERLWNRKFFLKLWWCWRHHLTAYEDCVIPLHLSYTHPWRHHNKMILVQKKKKSLISVLISPGCQKGKVAGKEEGEAEKRKERGHIWKRDSGALANKSSGLHHSLSPRRFFCLKDAPSPSAPLLCRHLLPDLAQGGWKMVSAVFQSHSIIIFNVHVKAKTCWVYFPFVRNHKSYCMFLLSCHSFIYRFSA